MVLKVSSITVEWMESEKEIRCRLKAVEGNNCIHPSLEVVHMIGFVGYKADDELISYLVERAPMLQKLTLDSRSSLDIEERLLECSDTTRARASKRLAEGLVKKFCALCRGHLDECLPYLRDGSSLIRGPYSLF